MPRPRDVMHACVARGSGCWARRGSRLDWDNGDRPAYATLGVLNFETEQGALSLVLPSRALSLSLSLSLERDGYAILPLT